MGAAADRHYSQRGRGDQRRDGGRCGHGRGRGARCRHRRRRGKPGHRCGRRRRRGAPRRDGGRSGQCVRLERLGAEALRHRIYAVHVRERESGAGSPRFPAGVHFFGSAPATATASLECAAASRRNAPATSSRSCPLGEVAVPGKSTERVSEAQRRGGTTWRLAGSRSARSFRARPTTRSLPCSVPA
jgi:hypothetical protein